MVLIKRINITRFSFISILLCCLHGYADNTVSNNLHTFFDKLGYMSNTTTPSAYQGQAAGYYTGGSLFLRNQVENYKLMSVEMPSFSGGCSGIDMYLGSFSVINSKELLKMMKNIMSAGGAYALDLALTTTVPQIKTVKDNIQKYMGAINSLNINSCNVAQDLVGGLWPKTKASQQQICRDVASHSGPSADWASARQGCGVGGQFNDVMRQNSAHETETIVNKNVIWSALMKDRFTQQNIEMAEFLMSLSGSVVIKAKSGDKPKITQLVSLVNQNFVKGILYGGEKVMIYLCKDTKKCLEPTSEYIIIKEGAGLVHLVSHYISELERDVLNDKTDLNLQEKMFLEMTPIPILKLITVEASLGQPLDTTQYSEIIAISILNQYLYEDIKTVQRALSLEHTPMNADLDRSLTAAQLNVGRYISEAYKKVQNTQALIANMRVMEQQLSSRLASRAETK